MQGSLPMPLVVLIIGRDVVLLTGAFVHRFRSVGWQWPGAAEFFRLTASSSAAPLSSAATAGAQTSSAAVANADTTDSINGVKGQKVSNNRERQKSSEAMQPQHADSSGHQQQQKGVEDHISDISSVTTLKKQPEGSQQEAAQDADQKQHSSTSTQPAAFVQPLYISKVNTCFQLLLVGGCLTSSWYAWPPEEALWTLGVVTGGTTLASCGAYVRAYLKGTIK